MKFLLRRKKLLLILLAAVVVGGYFVNGAGFLRLTVPPEFEAARLQGALIAENIVGLSRRSSDALQRINSLDLERKHEEALRETEELIKQSEEIRNQAVLLSEEVQKMTQALSKINSFEARQAALESISSRLALITRLISYSNYLSDLLNALRERFSGVPGDHQVINTINQINAEVNAINNFNREASEAMERFDAVINGK